MDTLESFLNTNKPKGFTPRPHYSAEGDSLTFVFNDTPYYGERIDDFLSVYRAMEGHGLVGCQIKGLPKVLRLIGDFGLSISDGSVKLTMIFMACMAQTPSQEARKEYMELGRVAAERDVSIPMEELKAAA